MPSRPEIGSSGPPAPADLDAPVGLRPPPAAAVEGDATHALRLVARREHELLALSELSQELTISLDLYGVADLVLFNLMGQLGTSRTALWLVSGDDPATAVLTRSHGIQKPMANALGSTCTPAILEHMRQGPRLLPVAELDTVVSPTGMLLVRQQGIALFAPILSRGELLGLLALGGRIDGGSYGEVELQVLQTSLGMVGVALQNTALYNRMLENNRQLRLANESLKELDRLKSEFLRNVNHELRTPLTITIAYVSCLTDALAPESQESQFARVALSEAQKLQGLLENLLTFSSVAEDRLPLQIVVDDVTGLLRGYHRDRLPGITEGLREFSFLPGPDLPSVPHDRQRLLQVVDLLVDNAVKFTPQGAHLELRAARSEDPPGDGVRIEVRDDGPGIPSDRLPALFDSFRQGDGSTTRVAGGMGLGLAVARRLIEKMGGTLEVTSELGRGATFTVYLPAS